TKCAGWCNLSTKIIAVGPFRSHVSQHSIIVFEYNFQLIFVGGCDEIMSTADSALKFEGLIYDQNVQFVPRIFLNTRSLQKPLKLLTTPIQCRHLRSVNFQFNIGDAIGIEGRKYMFDRGNGPVSVPHDGTPLCGYYIGYMAGNIPLLSPDRILIRKIDAPGIV